MSIQPSPDETDDPRQVFLREVNTFKVYLWTDHNKVPVSLILIPYNEGYNVEITGDDLRELIAIAEQHGIK